jgi:hypothetical protein
VRRGHISDDCLNPSPSLSAPDDYKFAFIAGSPAEVPDLKRQNVFRPTVSYFASDSEVFLVERRGVRCRYGYWRPRNTFTEYTGVRLGSTVDRG